MLDVAVHRGCYVSEASGEVFDRCDVLPVVVFKTASPKRPFLVRVAQFLQRGLERAEVVCRRTRQDHGKG